MHLLTKYFGVLRTNLTVELDPPLLKQFNQLSNTLEASPLTKVFRGVAETKVMAMVKYGRKLELKLGLVEYFPL